MQQILAVLYREFLIRTTSPLWLFFDLMLPLLYMLTFGVAFDKTVSAGMSHGGATVGYNAFFLAGVLSMSCFGTAINQSYGFFVDRDNGIFYEFLTYPMTRGQFLVGKIVFQAILAVVQCVLALLAAALLLDIPLKAEWLVFVFLAVMVGTAGWFFFLAIFAFLIRRNDMYNTVLNVGYFVLIFLSSMFYPLDNVPEWFRTMSYANPLTWLTDTLRFLTIGVGDFSTIGIEAVGFVLFLLAS
ncbi:MAG: ABC transporter permease, partial [Bacteroidota bacterium]